MEEATLTGRYIGKKMTREDLLGAIARGWCSEQNSHKTMDSDMAEAIADEVMKELDKIVEPEDALFERIWAATKHWDLDHDGEGYHGMTGDEVRTIIKAISGSGTCPTGSGHTQPRQGPRLY